MSPPAPARAQADDWSRRGSAAIDAQDLPAAKKCFKRAVELDRGNAQRHFHLAIVLEALQEFAAAAEQLTEALRIDPHQPDAARRFSALVTRQILPETARLNPAGLIAALQHEAASQDLVADAVIRYLSCRDPLRGVLELGRSKGWEAAARGLCLKRTSPLLRNDVFLALLRSGVIKSPALEQLLTALRRVLVLELPLQRLADGELAQFALALEQQCWVNEYVWMVSQEEARVIGEQQVSVPEFLAGDVEQAYRFLLTSLYGPTYKGLSQSAAAESLANVRPWALRDALAQRLAGYTAERARAARIPRLGRVADATSCKVALQYESAPYPRWTRLGMNLRQGEFRQVLAQYFRADQLGFMQQPFEVLVAGCGTGKDAIQVALGYGPNARVLALDLSASSLAYASRMADQFGVRNVEFIQADILEIGGAPDFHSRFRIIECGGVLHHMADPLQGWRSLIGCLAPGGLMRIALYSAIARRNFTALRNDPAYPGAGCDDAQLRAFRQTLMGRADDRLVNDLKSSPDFYSASGFRDLLLHVSERSLSIPEIMTFLAEAGLVFRGFQPALFFDLLHHHYPNEPWPGSLERWAELECANPILFAGMYKFWCEKA